MPTQSFTIKARPLSSNEAWQGRRFKTAKYTAFEREVAILLAGKRPVPIEGKLEVRYRFHFKNHKLRDWDNAIKSLQDVLVKLGVIADDRNIYRGVVEKVPDTEDYAEVEILPYQSPQQ